MESIFSISERYNTLLALLDDETVSQDEINEALASVMDDVTTKAANGIAFLHMMKARRDAAKAEKKRIDDYVKTLDSRIKRVEKAYLYGMNRMNMKSILTERGELKMRKNPCSVVIDDPDQVPDAFKVQSITITPNKTAIKDAIKAGTDVPGAHLEQSIGLKY